MPRPVSGGRGSATSFDGPGARAILGQGPAAAAADPHSMQTNGSSQSRNGDNGSHYYSSYSHTNSHAHSMSAPQEPIPPPSSAAAAPPPPASGASTPVIKRVGGKANVSSACGPCKRAHLACDVARPCKRCVNMGKEDQCEDVPVCLGDFRLQLDSGADRGSIKSVGGRG